MAILWKSLCLYRCATCRLSATIPVKATHTNPRCARCHAWMRYVDALPITTEEEQAQAQAGLVYLPFRREPVVIPTCDLCPNPVGSYGVQLPNGARYCWRHAEEGVRRYEAAQEPPPAHLLADASGE